MRKPVLFQAEAETWRMSPWPAQSEAAEPKAAAKWGTVRIRGRQAPRRLSPYAARSLVVVPGSALMRLPNAGSHFRTSDG